MIIRHTVGWLAGWTVELILYSYTDIVYDPEVLSDPLLYARARVLSHLSCYER